MCFRERVSEKTQLSKWSVRITLSTPEVDWTIIRKEKGISQEELAFKAGLNRAYVGYIERGERKPSVDTLAKLAKTLKIRLSELLS